MRQPRPSRWMITRRTPSTGKVPGVKVAGSLCRELQASRRFGDCDGEGVVWPRIAEVSLLGGLGTGRTLMDTVIAEVADRGDADFVVLQATDQAVPFYERLGFSKVGAVASFEEKGKSLPREAMCGLNASCEQLDNDGFTPGERARARLSTESLKAAEGRPLELQRRRLVLRLQGGRHGDVGLRLAEITRRRKTRSHDGQQKVPELRLTPSTASTQKSSRVMASTIMANCRCRPT